MNFSYTFVDSIDGTYGSLDEDGNWGGLVGMVARKEVHFCVTDLTVLYERAQVYTGLFTHRATYKRLLISKSHLLKIMSLPSNAL